MTTRRSRLPRARALIALSGCRAASPGRPPPDFPARARPPRPSSSRSPSPGPAPQRTVCVTTSAAGGLRPLHLPAEHRPTGTSTDVGNIRGPNSRLAADALRDRPGNWNVIANLPAGNTAVVTYPSSQQNPGTVPTRRRSPNSFHLLIVQRENACDERDQRQAGYDIRFDNPGAIERADDPARHVSHRGSCTDIGVIATVSFGGSGGVPVQSWKLCKYGSELIWRLSTGGNAITVWGDQSGSIDLLPMLNWVIDQGYIAADSGLGSVGYGWEICSTGGKNENSRYPVFRQPRRSAAS